jgi:hypothetical protein
MEILRKIKLNIRIKVFMKNPNIFDSVIEFQFSKFLGGYAALAVCPELSEHDIWSVTTL